MIKILHFITDSNIGGAGRLLCNQIKNMDTDKFAITVAVPHGSDLIKELSKLPCSIIQCDFGKDESFSAKAVAEDYRIIKRASPDIVHSHGSLSSRIAATALGIPCRIFTRHCVFPLSRLYKNPIVKGAVRLSNEVCSTAVLAVADSAKQNLIDMGCDKRKITTIINGVEPLRSSSEDEKIFLRSKYSLTDKNFVISIFARLEEYKGHKTLLHAAAICKKYYPDFRFFIVGDGSRKNELKDLAHQLNVDDIVYFTGFCDNVDSIFNITDINVNCSYGTETSSLALSEGMSLGIPCVASDYGGNTHMVKNAVNGLLYPAKNAEALAMSLIRLYRDRSLYEKCSLGALRRYDEEFTAKGMTEKMMRFYIKECAKSKK